MRETGESAPEADVTRLLQSWEQGDVAAGDSLFDLVYPELRKIAARQLIGSHHETLQPTELVHETYLRFAANRHLRWSSRLQFYALAARIARQVLVDRYRQKSSLKRGGAFFRLTADPEKLSATGGGIDLLALDEALERLAKVDSVAARAVELRFFGGLTIPEIARVLNVGEATVSRRWQMARAWLRDELR